MVNWSIWNGLDTNDTWSLAYYVKQQGLISEKTALIVLVGFMVLLVILMWKRRKNLFRKPF